MKGKAGGKGAVSSAMGGGDCDDDGSGDSGGGADRDANGLETRDENRNMPIELSGPDTGCLGRTSRVAFHLALVRRQCMTVNNMPRC